MAPELCKQVDLTASTVCRTYGNPEAQSKIAAFDLVCMRPSANLLLLLVGWS